jgi:dihydroorotate dehydrogenase/NAD-dependent dihydropyrimidine dehydrogenase PreA subunit
MAVDISTSVGGVRMRSPLGVASMLPSMNPWFPDTSLEYLKEKLYQKWLDNGVGYLKACTLGPELFQYERVRFNPLAQVAPGVPGYYTATPYHIVYRPHEVLPILDALKEMTSRYEDVPLIGSITAPTYETKTWVEMARLVEDRGADLLELNTFAPCQAALLRKVLPMEEAKWGSAIGCEPRIIGPIVEAVVRAVKIPVGVKLTADAGYPGVLRVLNACRQGGATFVDMFHQTLAIAPPDIYNGGKGPYLVTDGWNLIGLMSGEWNSYQSLKGAALTSMYFPELEIFAGGGITKPEQVIQNIMFGARAVETLSGIFFRGNSFIRQSLNFLKNYMATQGYKTLDDFRGVGIPYVKTAEEVLEKTRHLKFKAATDEAECSGCGLCADNVCPASYMEERIGKLDPEKCNGCGLCVLICPEGARRLVPAG